MVAWQFIARDSFASRSVP